MTVSIAKKLQPSNNKLQQVKTDKEAIKEKNYANQSKPEQEYNCTDLNFHSQDAEQLYCQTTTTLNPYNDNQMIQNGYNSSILLAVSPAVDTPSAPLNNRAETPNIQILDNNQSKKQEF